MIEIMDKLENDYKTIKYNKKTREIEILKWHKYNLDKVHGKSIIDYIKSQFKNAEDISLIEEVLKNIRKDEIRKLFI